MQLNVWKYYIHFTVKYILLMYINSEKSTVFKKKKKKLSVLLFHK